MAQAVQMQRKNDSGVYENYYPNTVMSQVEGGIVMKAKIVVTTKVAGQTITATGDASETATTDSNGVVNLYLPYGNYNVSGNGFNKSILVDSIKTYEINLFAPPLNELSWAEISEISRSGRAKSYFAVGDVKTIQFSGKITAYSTQKAAYTAFAFSPSKIAAIIMDFNHDASSSNGEKDGIVFTISTPITINNSIVYKPCAIGNTTYCYFNMNQTATNAGGWAKSHLRYGILGSTDSSSGGNASSTTATSPVSNTFMSCLPSDLRAVMRPMYVYTDNVGGGSDTESNVTGSLDYLPLPALFEVAGANYTQNSYEKNKQTQYQYYKNGNDGRRTVSFDWDTYVAYWFRSPCYYNDTGFTILGDAAANAYSWTTATSTDYHQDLAPMFKV